MIKVLLPLTMMILLFSSSLVSQTIQLSGKVSEKSSKENLFGVNVMIKNLDKSENSDKIRQGTSTDIDGNYKINLDEGIYEVKFNFIGYQDIIKTIEMKKDHSVVLDVEMEQKIELINEVVVSAGKYEQKLSEVTVSMEILKPQTIENNNSFNVEDALNQLPGVDINDHQPSIRSSTGWSYGAGSRVIILMDDLPIMSADAGDVKWNYIPTENISQIEVVKGASSALFGSSALGGVINVRSAYPTSKPETKISYFVGGYGNPKDERQRWWPKEFFSGSNSKLDIPLRKGLYYWVRSPMYSGISFNHKQQFDNLDLSLGGNHFIDEGYRENDFEKRSRFNTNIRYRSKKVEGLAVGLNANFMAIDLSDFFMWKSDTNAYLSNTNFEASAPTQGYRLNIDPFVYYYKPNGSKYSLRTRYFRTENTIPSDNSKNSAGNTFYGEFQYQTTFAEKWNLTAGAVETYSKIKSNMFGDHYSNNISIYGQLDVKFGRLKVSLGLRGEYFIVDSTQTESMIDIKLGKNTLEIPIKPVFRTGVNYELTEHTFIRASFGQGYRFPSIAEKYTATSLGMVNIFPNPRLTSETGWSSEIGIKQGYKLGDWMGYADLALYHQQINNMMEFTFGVFNPDTFLPYNPETDTTGGVMGFQSQNIGDVKISGIDISAGIDGKAGKFHITAMLGYSFNYPVFKNGKDTTASSTSSLLKYRNKHSIKADINFETKRLLFGFNIIWKSAVENVDRLFCDERDPSTVDPAIYNTYKLFSSLILPGYWDYRILNAKKNYVNVDVRFGFKFNKFIKASFIVKNLFNQEYVGRPGDMFAPRRFEVVLSANF